MLEQYSSLSTEGKWGACWSSASLVVCILQVKQHKEALSACQKVLSQDPKNVKALYRAGRVLSHLGETEEAVAKLKEASSLEPENTTIQSELQRAIKKDKVTREKERQMCRRMVGGASEIKGSPKEKLWVCGLHIMLSKCVSTLYTLAGSLALHGHSRSDSCHCHRSRLYLDSKTLIITHVNVDKMLIIVLLLETCA